MGFLKRLLGADSGTVPEWAPFDDGRDYTAFLDAVTADLQRRGTVYPPDEFVALLERVLAKSAGA